ncbi:MAG: adenine deaminase [Romboutsia sp.]
MKIIPKDKKGLIEAAIGRRKCSLVIENCKIVNVFSGEIYNGDIGIYGGFIAHIRCNPDELKISEPKIEGEKYYDANGKYVIPGLIDAHIHIESTLMTPRNFAKAVVPHGTTTVVTDPHEIANVYGIDGVEYMHNSSEGLPMRQYILAPSCVPAVLGLENSGAEFDYTDIERLFKLDRVIGLGEVMDYLGVINNDTRMVKILESAEKRGLFIQGHSPFLRGRNLSAYICGGAISDHESRTSKEARDKIRNGMYVDARESSISKNVSDIVKGIKDFRYTSNLTLCTDDREADEILEYGHMNSVVKSAIDAGMNPIDAIKSATLNTARELGIINLGGIAPNFVADLVLIDKLEDIDVKAVIYNGELVSEDGKLLVDISNEEFKIEKNNSVYINDLSLEDFKLKTNVNNGKIKANVIKYLSQQSSATEIVEEEFEVEDGALKLEENSDIKFVAIINRHNKLDTKSIGLVKGFGINKGSIGSTVSHDSHNLTIVFDNPNEAMLVAKDLIKLGGGLSCALDNKIKNNLQLSVAGLMSTRGAKEIAVQANKMKDSLREMGITEMKNPLLRIVTLALPVIPKGKMSDLGLVDVSSKKIIHVVKK